MTGPSESARAYLAKIGARGGTAGKGSPAKLASARKAAQVRWSKHKAKTPKKPRQP